ncbi:tyrosine-type recombinase/integrase [Actinomadura opuntiae]|uniref:tyrosine-type recombinase/integrase n=1 Tax=Actinomadura sp. OS1-43 TaxID=604315 RepID=UPI00255AE9EA|nr:tyrosine-type recombinase/integrase [Actinomadura sp. OS1-43]MDL4813088.1 tyrosine-type recombinase/integrase [Actinomadura sp. OS1-43]
MAAGDAVTGFRGQVRDYLALRREMGFKMEKYGPLLDSLADHLEDAGLASVTTQAAVEWAILPQATQPHRWKARLDAARGFARYLAASDPLAEVPPTGLLDARRNRHQPYIFTGQEISTLLDAAGQHRWHLPTVTYPALFGLIASTGMRLSEATGLDDADTDLDEAMITIRDSKFGKSRRIPVDETVVAALRDYRERRRGLRPARAAPAAPTLFISAYGTRLLGKHADTEFRRIIALTGIGASAVHPPRIHDLRHTFAVRTLASWYRDGGDVAARLPLLSAYLGHVSPVSTYWYLHAVPELLTLAAQRLENTQAAS